jgi:hypothetical protein
VSVTDLRRQLYPRASRQLAGTWATGRKSAIGYRVRREDGPLTVRLLYCGGDDDPIRIPVRVRWTPTQFDGERAWFTCPLIRSNMARRAEFQGFCGALNELPVPMGIPPDGFGFVADQLRTAGETARKIRDEVRAGGFGLADYSSSLPELHRVGFDGCHAVSAARKALDERREAGSDGGAEHDPKTVGLTLHGMKPSHAPCTSSRATGTRTQTCERSLSG